MPNTITEENLVKMIADGRGKRLVVKSYSKGKLQGKVKLKLRTSKYLYTLTVPNADDAKSIVKGCKDKVEVQYVDESE